MLQFVKQVMSASSSNPPEQAAVFPTQFFFKSIPIKSIYYTAIGWIQMHIDCLTAQPFDSIKNYFKCQVLTTPYLLHKCL